MSKHHHDARARWLGALRAAVPIATSICLAMGVSPLAAWASPKPAARAARTITLDESGNLHLLSKRGFTLNEQGTASGTIAGTIYVRLTIVSTSRVTAEVSISHGGGSISGHANAAYHRGSETATFSGSMSVSHGSGSYSNAQGSGLTFSGTIKRSNDAITVHVGGRMSV
jgi:hypothetical protein